MIDDSQPVLVEGMAEERDPHFHCALTGSLLDEPVWGADGRAYERKALEAFLKHGEGSTAGAENDGVSPWKIMSLELPEAYRLSADQEGALRRTLSASPPEPAPGLQRAIHKLLYLTERPFSEQVSEGVVDDLQNQLRRSYLTRDTCIKMAEESVKLYNVGRNRRQAWQDGGQSDHLASKLTEQEEDVERKIEEVRQKRIDVSRRYAHIATHSLTLDQYEKRVWGHLNASARERIRENAKNRAIRQQVASLEEVFETLKRVNISNEAFHIWHEGPFGIINGFRLGRLTSYPVEWAEVNAAWGQAALLLATIANRVGFTFSKYRIIPMGSYSKIAKLGQEGTTYDLNSSGGGMFSSFLSTFNTGMVAYLSCLREIGEYAMTCDRTLKLPHDMPSGKPDRVGSVSIRTSGQSDEKWTMALKYMLTNLKWLLYWATYNRE